MILQIEGGQNSRKLRECTSLDAPKQNNVNTAKKFTESRQQMKT